MHFLDPLSVIIVRTSYFQAEIAEAYVSNCPFTSVTAQKRSLGGGWVGTRLVST